MYPRVTKYSAMTLLDNFSSHNKYIEINRYQYYPSYLNQIESKYLNSGI